MFVFVFVCVCVCVLFVLPIFHGGGGEGGEGAHSSSTPIVFAYLLQDEVEIVHAKDHSFNFPGLLPLQTQGILVAIWLSVLSTLCSTPAPCPEIDM